MWLRVWRVKWLLLIAACLLLAGCRSSVGAAEAGNWICEHRGGVRGYDGGRDVSTVVCNDGTAHSVDLWREFDAKKQRQYGPYYWNSAEEPATRKEAT